MQGNTGVIPRLDIDVKRSMQMKERVSRDLSRFDTRRSVREAYNASEMAKVKSIAQTRTAAKARVGFRLNVFTVVGYVAIVALLVSIVFNYMQLNEITIVASKSQRELSALKQDEISLRNSVEKRMNLKFIEERALALGMVKPEREQMIYVDLSGGDHAVVIDGTGEQSPVLSTISAGFTNLLYFLS